MEFWTESPADFVLITVVLGGGAAYLIGRAVALTWRSLFALAGYLFLLGVAVRFFHFALAHDALLTPIPFAADLVVLAIVGSFGFRLTRAAQITRQYPWLYGRTGPLSWARNEAPPK
jgi:hypothetical protein